MEQKREQLNNIAKKYDLELLLLFGSQIDKKLLHQESDFDVAYLSKKDLTLMEESRLICDLMPIFRSEKVDLVNIKRANPLLMQQIFDNHKLLYCLNPATYSLYQIYAMKRYIEARPLFDLNRQFIKDFVNQYGR